MADPKQDNWRTKPAFNYEFTDFAECIQLAVLEFSKRPSVIFMLIRHDIPPFWLCMPWTQYRTAPVDHPCHSSSVVFRGNFFELRKIAYSIPPDLFSAAPLPKDHNIKPEADAIHDDALNIAQTKPNGSDPASVQIDPNSSTPAPLGPVQPDPFPYKDPNA
jgi:hypothetical protein